MKKLSPTSYALLGLLARKPWSAYELNTHMQHSVLKAFWPRAASGVYTEPKKLVANKLARAKEEERNGRLRTVYTITAAGRKELLNWLASPTETYVSMSFEAMLKFLYAEAGDLETLNDTIDSIEDAALYQARAVLAGVKPVVELAGEDSAGMPYNGMALNFLADVTEAQIHWAREVRAALKKFEDTRLGDDAREAGIKSYNHLISRLQEMVGENV
jgi:DNA-binding PadR family transcriptional regulator